MKVKSNIFKFLPDKEYLKLLYRYRTGKRLSFKKPVSFNEKLQWLKIYDRKPEYTTMVDKVLAKDYVGKLIGYEHIIPTYGSWNKIAEMDFSDLPDKFVLKCNHNSAGLIICQDKKQFDYQEAKQYLQKQLDEDYYLRGREWPYKDVVRKVFAEKFMEDETCDKDKGLSDYKIHCFNGIPKVILVCRNRFSSKGMTEDFFDIEWNHLDVRRINHGNSNDPITRPNELGQMLELAKTISRNIPFIRVDFYIIKQQIYFGELTFYPAGGFEKFVPESFDYEMGSWIRIDQIQKL